MIIYRVRFLLLNVAFVAWTFPLIAETYFVRPDGNDQAEGTSPRTAFKTLLRASHVLNHGDAVVLAPGIYHDEVLLAERFSADGSEMLIAGDESGKRTGTPPGPVVIRADNPASPALDIHRFRKLRICGLTFRGPGQGLQRAAELGRRYPAVQLRGPEPGTGPWPVPGRARGKLGLQPLHAGPVLPKLGPHATGAPDGHRRVRGGHPRLVFRPRRAPQLAVDRQQHELDRRRNLRARLDQRLQRAGREHGAVGQRAGRRQSVRMGLGLRPGPPQRLCHAGFPRSGQVRPAPGSDGDLGRGIARARVGQVLDPKVELDRDGRPLTVREGAVCAGRVRLPGRAASQGPAGGGWRSNLHGQGPRQSAAVYAADGALVRTLLADAAGVHELWWDGLDDLGQPVPAGRYQVRAITHDARLVDDGAVGDNGNPLVLTIATTPTASRRFPTAVLS